jgi:hypothetical protein
MNDAGAGGDLPAYDDLPVQAGLPERSSWNVWDAGDRLACLNLLTPKRVAAGLAAVRDRRVFPLDLAVDLPGPPLFNRSRMRHTVTAHSAGHDDVCRSGTPRHAGSGTDSGMSGIPHSASTTACQAREELAWMDRFLRGGFPALRPDSPARPAPR